MIKVNVLQNVRAVEKFVLRSIEGIDGVMGKVRDTIITAGGISIYEKKVSEQAYFCIVSFPDETLMRVWEASANMQIGTATQLLAEKATIKPIHESKVLIVSDDTGDDEAAKAKIAELTKDIIEKYKAAVLEVQSVKNAKYRVIMFFTDEKLMKDWERTFDVQNS